MSIPDLVRVEVSSEAALWAWLEAQHQSTESYLLVTWKKAHANRYVSRDQVLDALLAYGWIDGRRYTLDQDRTMQLICQRQQQSWTRSYRDRYDRLCAEGRMMAAGAAVAERARQNGTWLAGQDVDDLEDPDDLTHHLKRADGLDHWRALPPSYRRNILRWLASAKKPETRSKRLSTIVEAASHGRKIPNY